ncbi:MAG: methionine gamma-lyase family protein [Oscillospiraceae bacterium]|nr:methionine gamma-lyase family protein [Oscillospiraceae bacterium]
MDFSERVLELARQADEAIAPALARIDEIARKNTQKVLAAFQTHRVAEAYFAGTTGYGSDDRGREILDQVFATTFGAEDALVRIQMVSGTHTLICALFGVLRPGDEMISLFGPPYDTLQTAIGIVGHETGTLLEYGIRYSQVDPNENNEPDLPEIIRVCAERRPRLALIQRSRGYSTRAALSIETIRTLAEAVHQASPETVVMVDNCYGEFTDTLEPTQVGADLMAGSLIKNPGGGIAPMGGYIAGRHDLVEGAASRLTAPGIGRDNGATLGQNRLLYQGFFLAPHTVAQALKTAVFCAKMMELMGFETSPAWDAARSDIVQVIALGSGDALLRFCRGIQMGSPVDSFVIPEAWPMAGYEDPVVMAAGAFVSGASIELSCDGPMREPYLAYLQGGLTYESGRLGILLAAEELLK